MVQTMRGAAGEDLKVVRRVVSRVSVLVMDLLAWPELPPQHLGCNMAMHEEAALEAGVVVLLLGHGGPSVVEAPARDSGLDTATAPPRCQPLRQDSHIRKEM
jgi:hypothetical protein